MRIHLGGRRGPAPPQPVLLFVLSAAIVEQPEGMAASALRLKRTLEAAVRLVRGAASLQDEGLGAYADFLEDGMTSHPQLRSRTIAVSV